MALSVVIPQAPTIAEASIVPAASYASSDTAGPWPVDFWSSAEIAVVVTQVTGSLDVYLQKLLPDGTTYDDIAHFAQWTTATFTTTGSYVLSFVNGGNTINQQKAASLTANTVNTVHFGSYWRVNYVIATGPCSFSVTGSFRQ
jgi:hypothetical protein